MPASTLLLIAIGILSVCAFVVHTLIRQSLSREYLARESSSQRLAMRTPHEAIVADWIRPADRDLTSASI